MTAVQWYAVESINLIMSHLEGKIDEVELTAKLMQTLTVAKEMEKQQLEEAYRTSIKDSIDAKQ